MKDVVSFRDLLDEDIMPNSRECDEWEDELSFEKEHRWDGLDEGFSSWQDYYNYKFG